MYSFNFLLNKVHDDIEQNDILAKTYTSKRTTRCNFKVNNLLYHSIICLVVQNTYILIRQRYLICCKRYNAENNNGTD